MKRRNVLMLIDAMNGGGAERVLSFVLRQIVSEDFNCTLYLIVKEGIYLNQIHPDIEVRYLFAGDTSISNPLLRIINKVYRAVAYRVIFRFPFLLPYFCLIRKGEYDLAVSFCEGYNTLLLGKIKSRFKACVQWLQVDVRNHEATFNPQAFDKAIQHMDAFVGVSAQTLEGFNKRYEKYGLKHMPQHVVYNPVDVDRIHKLAAEPFADFSKFTFIAIGRLQQQKRFDRLIQAHAMLVKKGYDIQTIILGKGELQKSLADLCHKLNVHESVRFEGFQPNAYTWLKKADVFVLSSDYEGFPGVVCEAMTLSKPIVATTITGTVELLENGRWGLLTDTNSVSLADAMERMLTDDTLRKRFSQLLSEHQGKFLFKNHIADVVDVIHRYLPT
ncbi:MAG: glycosyltransferase [Bacteroidota bacterium]|jgi:glycosyltransferase involved in cell wall biosynthesis